MNINVLRQGDYCGWSALPDRENKYTMYLFRFGRARYHTTVFAHATVGIDGELIYRKSNNKEVERPKHRVKRLSISNYVSTVEEKLAFIMRVI